VAPSEKYLGTPRTAYPVIAACIVILIILSVCRAVFLPLKTEEVIVRVRPGDTTRIISHKLKAEHVIRSAFWFDVITALTKSDRKLKSGRYVFGGDVSIMQTVDKIRHGKSTLLHLTIPEGFSLKSVLRTMTKAGIAPYDSLKAIANDPVLIKNLTGGEHPSLEGFLYPETYTFDIDIAPADIFALMSRQFFCPAQ